MYLFVYIIYFLLEVIIFCDIRNGYYGDDDDVVFQKIMSLLEK